MKLKECDICLKQKPIYKNQVIDEVRYRMCQQCSFTVNKKSLTPNKKQIKKRSDKKVMEDRIYTVLRNKYLTNNPNCQINTAGCTTNGTEIHHTEYRTGDKYLDIETWLTSCRTCHNWVHSNPIEARELGFLK